MTSPHEADSLSARRALWVLRRRAGVIVACLVLTPAAAYLFSTQQEEEYSATATLLIGDSAFDQKLSSLVVAAPALLGSTVLPPSDDPKREVATNIHLASLDLIARRTADRLRSDLTWEDVRDRVDVAVEGESDVISVTATHPDPRFAARLANTFAREYTAFRRAADRRTIGAAQDVLERQLEALPAADRNGSRGRSLLQRANELEVIAALQTGNVDLVERAEPPDDPSSPNTALNTALGGVIGLMLGLGLAFLFERVDRRHRDPKELGEAFDRPVLATIPESKSLATHEMGSGRGLPPQEAEAFRMLRANIRYFNADRDVRSVLVTSAEPGDGKSTVAWQLAVAASAPESKVLLVEADLRHPTLGRGLGVSGESRSGLSSVLAGQAELSSVIEEVPVAAVQNGKEPRTIDVLLAGPIPPDPHDLIESHRMQEILTAAMRDYDLVVLDTPPTSVVSDAIPLMNQVDGVIVVGRLSKSTRQSVAELSDHLRNLGAPILGVVVNGATRGVKGYGASYGDRDLAASAKT